MNLPPLHRLTVCHPCAPTAPTDVNVQELLKAAEELDELKTEGKIVGQPKKESSSLECVICYGSLLKGTDGAPYPPGGKLGLQDGAYGHPYVVVCANGHLFHKECIKLHLRVNDARCPECRQTMFSNLDLKLYPKEDTKRVQRDLFKYVKEKKPEVVAYLLAVGANPNAFQGDGRGGWNALLLAALGGHLGVVRALLDDPRTNLRLTGRSTEQRADEIAEEDRGEDDPVYKLLAQELARVERGERAEGEPAPAPTPTPAKPPEEEEAQSTLRPLRLDSADEEEPRGRGCSTHPVVAIAIRFWWRHNVNYPPFVEDTQQFPEEWSRQGICTWEDLQMAVNSLASVFQRAGFSEELIEEERVRIYDGLKQEITEDLQATVEYRAVMVHLTGDPEGTGPRGLQAVSEEERAEIVEWLMRGLDEVAVEFSRDSDDDSASNASRRYQEVRERLVTIRNELLAEEATANALGRAQYRNLAA